MIGRKGYILILLFLSWPVDNIHRLWNNAPIRLVKWHPFNRGYEQDIQWYVHDIAHTVSYMLIFIAIYLYIEMPKKRDNDIITVFTMMMINQAIDLVHYIGWHRHNEWVLTLEGLIIIYASLKILIKRFPHGKYS